MPEARLLRANRSGSQSVAEEKGRAEATPVDPSGLGIGFGLALFGTLLLTFPLFLPLGQGWLTVILVIATVLTVIGVGGIFQELSKHRSSPWLVDVGTACVVLGLASALLIIHARSSFPYGVHLTLVVLMFALVAIGLCGLGIGLSKGAFARSGEASEPEQPGVLKPDRGDQLRRNDKFNIGVAIACTLVQCVVSIVIAFLTAGA